jgi:hypothetical protein
MLTGVRIRRVSSKINAVAFPNTPRFDSNDLASNPNRDCNHTGSGATTRLCEAQQQFYSGGLIIGIHAE